QLQYWSLLQRSNVCMVPGVRDRNPSSSYGGWVAKVPRHHGGFSSSRWPARRQARGGVTGTQEIQKAQEFCASCAWCVPVPLNENCTMKAMEALRQIPPVNDVLRELTEFENILGEPFAQEIIAAAFSKVRRELTESGNGASRIELTKRIAGEIS